MSNEGVIIPKEYKDLGWRLTYFLLGKVAHFIPRSIKPNQITVGAFMAALMACALLYFLKSPVGLLYWALFNFVWYILDALDGIHARLTQQTSEFGAFLDHFLDNISFIFTFTVFALYFDLLHPLYLFILLARFTAATTTFLVQMHTGKLPIGKFTGSSEAILMTAVMFLTYYFPGVDLSHYAHSTTLLYGVNALSLHQGVFMKLVLLFYAIAMPINFVAQWRFVKKNALPTRHPA